MRPRDVIQNGIIKIFIYLYIPIMAATMAKYPKIKLSGGLDVSRATAKSNADMQTKYSATAAHNCQAHKCIIFVTKSVFSSLQTH